MHVSVFTGQFMSTGDGTLASFLTLLTPALFSLLLPAVSVSERFAGSNTVAAPLDADANSCKQNTTSVKLPTWK
jgi:hypothetical protein